MRSTTMARGVMASVRFVGVTAAVAAGIAGFATTSSAPSTVVEAAASQQACTKASDIALNRAVGLASCTVVVTDPVFGDPITDPIFGDPVVHGRH